MSVTRKNVEFAKRVFVDRLGDPYVYGAQYNAFDLRAGADCSGSAGIFIGAAINGADKMSWGRQFSTESFPGPFGGFRQVSQADLLNNPYPIKVCIHHGGGGPNSHMQCQIDGWVMESNGDHGTCTTGTGAIDPGSLYWNDWWVLDGPIIEDGTPRTQMPDAPMHTFFADVSEFQVPVDDSYNLPALSIRVCDGTYQDHKFAQNYAWMRKALDSGKLQFGIVYTYVRPNWQDNANTVRSMIDANGGLHPKVALMLDVESGGNPAGDGSAWINSLYNNLAQYAGNPARVIGYANKGDFNSMWVTRPQGLRVIAAGYGSNPNLPGQVAHQYTDGQSDYGQGLPISVPPFGNCDMNVADNLSPTDFALSCGITNTPPPPPPAPPAVDPFVEWMHSKTDRELIEWLVMQQGPGDPAWPSKGTTLRDMVFKLFQKG